ncbi:hypothetical protein FA15DRAFT_671767 [Coprinopsis marcescibilis]|uniref:Uncharacterized protein n=1 Tax=Coprinopsis marcescibilis TaxID=230819 RepID=A0A5C3KNX9_COPMA|nr:hypothetical protein FA15DRAFT_671767 [Coprinopsis marcescibilis]
MAPQTALFDRLSTRTSGNGRLRGLFGRTRSRKIVLLACLSTAVLLLLYLGTYRDPLSGWSLGTMSFGILRGAGRLRSVCSPEEYAAGNWLYRPYHTRPGPLTKTYDTNSTILEEGDDDPFTENPAILRNMTKSQDIFNFTRFDGCASSREYFWHLAADSHKQFDRFPGPTEWEWVPGGRCKSPSGLRDWNREDVVKEFAEGGGWLLVGDSVTENHFFSLSCLLYPHVIGFPDYNKLTGMYDRSWAQHLYLNPDSPILKDINLPSGFNLSSTPLVTFRRVDLLWSKSELETMHKELHPEFYDTTSSEGFSLFGEERTWSIPPKEYLDIFYKPLPEGNYATMVVSTAGHWTTNLFRGYHLDEKNKKHDGPPIGYDALIGFYNEVMSRWAEDVQHRLTIEKSNDVSHAQRLGRIWSTKDSAGNRRRDKKVLVRAYLPGHEDCHKKRSPCEEIQPFQWNFWNWPIIWKFNEVFKNLLSVRSEHPDVIYLPIDRPGRLRPDAHSTGDCLHIMSGAGVLEGWSHYIWHFITREI